GGLSADETAFGDAATAAEPASRLGAVGFSGARLLAATAATLSEEGGTTGAGGADTDGAAAPSPSRGAPVERGTTARRLTTVGRMRSSTVGEVFCFSM